MANNINATLSELDKQNIEVLKNSDTPLINQIILLRQKPIKDFTIEDLRILIGQNCNLDILIPIAIDRLQTNILIEGDLYEGDLFESVLQSDSNYWIKYKDQWQTIKNLYIENKHIFEADNIYRQIRKSFESFESIFN